MPNFSFVHEGRNYYLDFKDKAVMDNHFEVEITAREVDQEGNERIVPLTLRIDLESMQAHVMYQKETLYTFNLAQLGDTLGKFPENDATNEGFAVGEPAAYMEEIDSGFTQIAERALGIAELIPVGEPIFGCLLKGGISATLRQAIECSRTFTPDDLPLRERVGIVARCMRDNYMAVFTRSAWRAAVCFVRLGV